MPEPSLPLLQTLATLVVKDRVHLGGLPAAQRSLALAWVWAGLPATAELNEPGINDELKGQLAGATCWLDTDHVELRRWLVDAGALSRDGFGRVYRRVPLDSLPPALALPAQALAAVDTAAWTRAQRAAHQHARAARRQAWQAQGST
jgi:hypothetical protein